MSAINEVKKIQGFDPLHITPENVHLAAFWIPSLMYEIRIMMGQNNQKIKSFKIKQKKTHRIERMRLMELRKKGTGPGGVKLTDDAVKFLSANSEAVLQYDEAIRTTQRKVDELTAYYLSLKDAMTLVYCYLGHLREEVKTGMAQHRLSHHFQRKNTVPVEEPSFHPETGELIEEDKHTDTVVLPDVNL